MSNDEFNSSICFLFGIRPGKLVKATFEIDLENKAVKMVNNSEELYGFDGSIY